MSNLLKRGKGKLLELGINIGLLLSQARLIIKDQHRPGGWALGNLTLYSFTPAGQIPIGTRCKHSFMQILSATGSEHGFIQNLLLKLAKGVFWKLFRYAAFFSFTHLPGSSHP